MVRLLLTVVFSYTTTLQSKLNNYIIQLIVGAMSIVIVGGQVYKDRRLTVLETVSYINIICLSVTTILFTDTYDDMYVVSVDVIVSVSVSVEILLFVIIVTVHCCLMFKKVFPNLLHCKTHVPSEDELPLIASDASDTEGSSPCIITRREELIFDFYHNEEHP